jgi:hypothetical protein
MHLKTTAISLSAALALSAAPALAKKPTPPHDNGKATAPGQLCKAQSHKKTNKGKGKSPFAACVTGAKRAQAELREQPKTTTAPGQLCKDQSHKKSATDKKSPFAACVTGAAKAQQEQQGS